jgi:hypothetical protein
MARVNGPVRLVLTVELDAIAEPVEGLVRSAGRPDQSFSGWSELFAVLIALASNPGGDEVAPDRSTSGGPGSRDAAAHPRSGGNPHSDQSED